MPQENLHLTAMEMTHSKTAEEIQHLVSIMKDKIPTITDYTFSYRARLIKPMIGFDASALALSFVPAAGEGLHSGRTLEDDQYTYHHLRRDLYDMCNSTSAPVDSRYVVPTSHLTVGRFIYAKDLADEAGKPDEKKMEMFIKKIEAMNEWLRQEFWPEYNDGRIPDGGEWVVGEEKGLELRMGTVWYGDGCSVRIGKGFWFN